jgi:hypothetical protein
MLQRVPRSQTMSQAHTHSTTQATHNVREQLYGIIPHIVAVERRDRESLDLKLQVVEEEVARHAYTPEGRLVLLQPLKLEHPGDVPQNDAIAIDVICKPKGMHKPKSTCVLTGRRTVLATTDFT